MQWSKRLESCYGLSQVGNRLNSGAVPDNEVEWGVYPSPHKQRFSVQNHISRTSATDDHHRQTDETIASNTAKMVRINPHPFVDSAVRVDNLMGRFGRT